MWKHCTAAALSVALCLQAQRGAVRPEFTASQIGLASGYSAGWLWPGEAHSIYGKNLGPAQSCTRDAEQPLPTELCGVRVLIDEGPVPLLYVHERQVNFMAPGSGSSGGKVALRVVHEGVSSIPVACGIGRFLPSSACPHIEVTFNGLPLPELKAKTRPRRIRYSGPPCPNPTPDRKSLAGRVPLHLQCRFDQPGIYLVRYVRAAKPPFEAGPTTSHRSGRPSR